MGSIMAKKRTTDGVMSKGWDDLKLDRIEDLSLEELLEKKLTGTLNGVDAGLESTTLFPLSNEFSSKWP